MDRLIYGQFDPTRSESPFNDSSYTDPASEVESRKQLGFPFLEVQEYINDKLVPTVEDNATKIETVRTDSSNTYATKTVVNALNDRVAKVEQKSGLADVTLVAGTNVVIDDLGKVDNVRKYQISSIGGGGGGGGVTDYNQLTSKPSINGVALLGNRTGNDLGLVAKEDGKGLSTNDFTSEDKTKLDSLHNYDDTNVYNRIRQTEMDIASLKSHMKYDAFHYEWSVNPSPLSEYEWWDTDAEYGYYFDIPVEGMTSNSVIHKINMSLGMAKAVAPYAKSKINMVRFYTKNSDSVDMDINGILYEELISEQYVQ